MLRTSSSSEFGSIAWRDIVVQPGVTYSFSKPNASGVPYVSGGIGIHMVSISGELFGESFDGWGSGSLPGLTIGGGYDWVRSSGPKVGGYLNHHLVGSGITEVGIRTSFGGVQ